MEKLIQQKEKKKKIGQSCPDKQKAKLFKQKWKVLKKEENFGSLVLINRKQIEISMKKKVNHVRLHGIANSEK